MPKSFCSGRKFWEVGAQWQKQKSEKIKKLADAMYYAAQNLTTDASRLHKAMEEYHQFMIHHYYED